MPFCNAFLWIKITYSRKTTFLCVGGVPSTLPNGLPIPRPTGGLVWRNFVKLSRNQQTILLPTFKTISSVRSPWEANECICCSWCRRHVFSLLYLPLTPPSYTSTTPPTLLVNSFISDIDQYVNSCYQLPLFPIYPLHQSTPLVWSLKLLEAFWTRKLFGLRSFLDLEAFWTQKLFRPRSLKLEALGSFLSSKLSEAFWT